MAYLIFSNDNTLYRIAANDTDLNSLNLPNPIGSAYNVQTISDADFELVRTNQKSVSFDGTTITYADQTWKFPNEANLKGYMDGFPLFRCSSFLNCNESTHAMYSNVIDYQNTLLGFDRESITYPLNTSWEQYCSSNSITYYHPLQIP